MNVALGIWDTLCRRKVPAPLAADLDGAPLLRLYVCGITPYDSGHMGHAFTFLAFDVLIRYLEAQSVKVRYVQNVTDVDDPLFERARRRGVDWKALAEGEQSRFVADLDQLGWRRPDAMPRVSEEIESILEAVRGLAGRDMGYSATDGLYFPASAFPGFGQLSGRSRLSMLRKLREEGLLGEVGPGRRRDPLDFPLWRPSASDEPAWPSEFGPGRPGWHIECSAMSQRHLGDQIDIHGGGRDLIYSHHEAERAQSESLTGKAPFARAWMHTGMVRFEGRKMSKSLGNLVLVGEALERAGPLAVRLYLASHHYRRDWEFRWEGLERLTWLADSAAELVRDVAMPATPPPTEPVRRFRMALDDDLDTPGGLRAVRQAVREQDASSARWMLGILAGGAIGPG